MEIMIIKRRSGGMMTVLSAGILLALGPLGDGLVAASETCPALPELERTLPDGARVWVVDQKSPRADDCGPGDLDAPLRTIQRGAESARPGDIVLVREGIYRERVAPPRGGEPGRPIIYRAEPSKNVIIRGSDVWSPKWERDGVLHGAVPNEALFTDDHYWDDKNPFQVELSSTPFGRNGKREVERGFVTGGQYEQIVYTLGQVYVNGRLYRQVPLKQEAEREVGTWWVDRASGKIYVHFPGDPAERTVEITTRRRVFAPHRRGLGHIHVVGFVMEHCGNNYPTNFWQKENPQWQQAGTLGTRSGHHWHIEGNVFRLGMVGIDVGYESLASQDRGDIQRGEHGKNTAGGMFHVIVNNHIVDNFGAGTAGVDAHGVQFLGNIVERNNLYGFSGSKRWESGGIKLHRSHNSRFIGNLLRHNQGGGMWLDQGAGNDTVVQQNVFVGNQNGFDLEIGNMGQATCFVAHNVFLDNERQAVLSRESGGLVVMNNLIAGSDCGYLQAANIGRDHGTAPPWSWNAQHHWCFDNLFVRCATGIRMQPPGFQDRPDLIDGRRLDGNVYADTAQQFRIEGRAEPLRFDQWRQAWHGYNRGRDCEQHSTSGVDITYQYDDQTMTLTVVYNGTPPTGVFEHPTAPRDFFGEALPSTPLAGPFQSLVPGRNVFRLWSGIRPLAEYELPYGGSALVPSPDDRVLDPPFNPGKNRVIHGDFAAGLAGWDATVTAGARATFSVDSGICSVVTEVDGRHEWEIMLRQSRILLERGTYVVRFDARADEPRQMQAAVIQDALPQPSYFSRVIALSPTWQTHEHRFTLAARQENARIHFRFATHGTSLAQLRNVSLRRIR